MVDIGINGSFCNDVINIDSLTFLATAVNTTDSLLNPHRVPRQIIVNHHITELVVKAFGTNLRKQQNIDCIRVGFLQLKTLLQRIPLFILDAAIHLFHT